MSAFLWTKKLNAREALLLLSLKIMMQLTRLAVSLL